MYFISQVEHKRKVKTESEEYVSILAFFVKDETGIIKVTAWRGKADSLTISQNDVVSIEHGLTSTYQDEQKVDANTHTIITVSIYMDSICNSKCISINV